MYKHTSIVQHIDNADKAEDATLACAEALIAIAQIMYNDTRARCLQRR